MYNLNTNNNQFSEKAKSVFDSLSHLESAHRLKVNEYSISEMQIEEPLEEEKNPLEKAVNSNKIKEEFVFKVPSTDFKQILPSNKKSNQPDYVLNPQKWKRYSLEDVDTNQMTNKSNYMAAMSFLNARKQHEENETMEHSEQIEFNKPFGKKDVRVEDEIRNKYVDDESSEKQNEQHNREVKQVEKTQFGKRKVLGKKNLRQSRTNKDDDEREHSNDCELETNMLIEETSKIEINDDGSREEKESDDENSNDGVDNIDHLN